MHSQALLNAQKQLQLYRQRDGVETRQNPFVFGAAWLEDIKPDPAPNTPPTTPKQPPTTTDVTVHPSLMTALMRDNLESIARIWLLARALDPTGRGMVTVADLRQFVIEKHQIMGQRRLRQILASGNGRFWDRTATAVFYYQPARVARIGGYGRFTGKPVEIPLKALTGGIHVARAYFYASFHAGRGDDKPISREAIREVTGAAANTQKTYDATAKVKAKTNYAILTGDIQEAAYQAGNASFPFVDYKGKQGPKNGRYLARQLPNTYKTKLGTKSRMGTKRVNRILPTNGRRAMGSARLYHLDGKRAARHGGFWAGRSGLWHEIKIE